MFRRRPPTSSRSTPILEPGAVATPSSEPTTSAFVRSLVTSLALVPLVALVACGGDEPTAPTQLPPDATQPVNSMTQDSAMVPGGELEPQPAPENP